MVDFIAAKTAPQQLGPTAAVADVAVWKMFWDVGPRWSPSCQPYWPWKRASPRSGLPRPGAGSPGRSQLYIHGRGSAIRTPPAGSPAPPVSFSCWWPTARIPSESPMVRIACLVIMVNPIFSTRDIYDLNARPRGIPSDGAPLAPHYLGSANYR